MLNQSELTIADAAAVKADLAYMTARWHELKRPVVFEIRALKENAHPQTFKFAPDWIDEAVDTILNMNKLGYNIYAVRNPIRHDVSGSASDPDIVAAFFLWADCDDPAAAGNVYRFDGPKWSAAVTTGRTPSVRVHTYWELKEPCFDLAAWEAMQVTICQHFASDSTVINPSRIMRVGGTVSYPFKRKRDRGYVNELTTLRTEYDDAREPVTLEQMARVFGERAPARQSLSQAATAKAPRAAVSYTGNVSGNGLSIDTGPRGGKSSEEYADILRRARTDGEKHGGVRDLSAHLAGSGVSRTMAEAIIRDACPVWDEGVEKLIDSAYAKFSPQATQFRELTPAEVEAIPAALFKPWVAKDLTAIPYPQFVYSDFYAKGYTSVTLAPPKVGKSMLGLAEAIDIATGRGFLTGVQRDPQRVVYFNAEDDQDVIDSRVSALLTAYGIDQSEIVGMLYPTSGVDLSDFYMVSGQEGVINEPLFVSIEKFIAETGAAALIFDPLQDLSRSPETNEVFRLLGQRLRRMASSTGVALGLIHHTRKIAPGTTPTIDDGRGGSALRGTARFNRLLIGMSEDEGAKAGVSNHRHYLRIGDMESNLAPPSSELNRWFEKVSVLTPNGHSVGAIKPWEWPDAFQGISKQDAAKVRSMIGAMTEPPRADVRSANWAGVVIADALGIDLTTPSGKAKTKSVFAKWVATDVLRITEGRDNRAGRPVNVVVAGDNNPLTEVSE